VDHAAQFVVLHTTDWPSGAWWSLRNGRTTLPFAEVSAWSPDPAARPPAAGDGAAPEPADEPQAGGAPRPALVDELLTEVGRAGRLIRLVPPGTADWSPHPDVLPLGALTVRLAQIVARVAWIIELDHVEAWFEPPAPELPPPAETAAAYAADERAVTALAEGLTAADLRAPWRLERGGEVVVEMPRGNALRAFGIAPLVYHRGEAGLLLTALGVRVPHPYPLWTVGEATPAGWAPPQP
jgi:hypothetical protein